MDNTPSDECYSSLHLLRRLMDNISTCLQRIALLTTRNLRGSILHPQSHQISPLAPPNDTPNVNERYSSLRILSRLMDSISICLQRSIALLTTRNLRGSILHPQSHQISPLAPPNVAASTQLIHKTPTLDLTSSITRCGEYPVSCGAYGDIYKCVYHGPDGDIDVAVKAIRIFYGTSLKVPRRELGIWKRLQHKNILKFMGTTRHFGPSVALVAPWIDNGSLTSFLSQNNGTLTLRDRLLLLRDIADGLNYLHTFSIDGHAYSNAVVHGDLTGNNVLVGSDGTAYLADFGLSGTSKIPLGMTYLAKTGCHPGALRWTAPELLDEESASAVTAKCDMYSFGCIVLQVLTGNVPWPHLTSAFTICRKVSFQGEMHPRPDGDHIIDRHWNFMTHCWSKIPDDRPSAEEALQFIDSELALEGSTLP